MKAGDLLVVTLTDDARPTRAVYLGPGDVGTVVFVAVDLRGVDGWVLMVESEIATMEKWDPPITMVVLKDTSANRADFEALVELISEANRDPSGFIMLPADVMAKIEVVTVQDTPDAPDAVETLRKILALLESPNVTNDRDKLTPEEEALCEQLRP